MQTLRVPCNFFSSPFPLTPCIALIPSLPLSFYFSPPPLASTSRISRFRPGFHNLLRLRRTRARRVCLENLKLIENRWLTIVRISDSLRIGAAIFDFLMGHVSSLFLSFFLSLSLLISYSLEQSCQLETDFLLTYVNVAKSTLSKYGKYLFSSPLTTRVGYHVFRPIVQYLIKANMEGANSERTSEINRENLWLTVRRIRIL